MTVEMVAAFLVGTVAVARLTRLVVDDDWPPIVWVRRKWDDRTNQSGWNELLHCPFCMSVWFSLADTIVAYATSLHWLWWLPNIWLAAAYLAAIINVRDVPPEL